MGDRIELLALDKADVVRLANEAGALAAQEKGKPVWEKVGQFLLDPFTSGFSSADKSAITELGLDSHVGRKKFLSEKLGVDATTSDDFRLVAYANDLGQMMLFRGRMDGEKKLILTESIPVANGPERISELLKSSFKLLLKPIEVEIEKVTISKDGKRIDLSPEQQKKLETEASLAAAIIKSGNVELTSNARLPGIQQGSGVSLTT